MSNTKGIIPAVFLSVVFLSQAVAAGLWDGEELRLVGEGPVVAYALAPDYMAYGLGRGNDLDEAKANAVAACDTPLCDRGEKGSMVPACISVAGHPDGRFTAGFDFSRGSSEKVVLEKCAREVGEGCELVGTICSQ